MKVLSHTWFKQIDRRPEGPVFPNRAGKPMSRSDVENRLRVAIAKGIIEMSLTPRPYNFAPYGWHPGEL